MTKTNAFTLLLLSAFLFSCKKDDPQPISANPTGTLFMHLHYAVDATEAEEYNVDYMAEDGRKINIELSQFYMSEFELVRMDGSVYHISGTKILKHIDQTGYEIGEVPVGNYTAIRFKVGLDAATNAMSPSASADSSILNRPEMWFGSSAQPEGYIFFTAKGLIDTTASMTGTMTPFNINIGTNAHYTQVVMDNNFSIISGQVEYLHMLANIYSIFSGLHLNNTANLNVTDVAGNSSWAADVISANISNMFGFEDE